MTKVQIVENEDLLQYADFDNCEVWLLNRTNNTPLPDDVINIPEVTESLLDSATKFPKLLTEIYEKHGTDIDYEVITDDAEHFAVHAYTCDYEKIKVTNLLKFQKTEVVTENTEPQAEQPQVFSY